MSSWDKMDKKVWEESEVMQEFEKNIINAAHVLADSLTKQAGDLGSLPKDLQDVNREAGPASSSLKQVADAVEKIYDADDGESEEEISDDIDKEVDEIEENLISLMDELQKLSYYLADNGDTSLAYKIERFMNELGEEVDED